MYKFYVKMLQVEGRILIMLGSWGETLPEAMRIGKRDAVPDADTFSLRVARNGTKRPSAQWWILASHYRHCAIGR